MHYGFINCSHHAVLCTYLLYNWRFAPHSASTNVDVNVLSTSSGFWVPVAVLDSAYKGDHMVFVFLDLTYSTCHNSLKVLPCYCKWQDFIPYYG